MMNTSVPLGCCRPGEAVRVDWLDADTAFASRLRAMGIHDGVQLEIVRDGATMIVQIDRGSRLCLRGDDVSHVWVSPVPIAAPRQAPYYPAEGADARI